MADAPGTPVPPAAPTTEPAKPNPEADKARFEAQAKQERERRAVVDRAARAEAKLKELEPRLVELEEFRKWKSAATVDPDSFLKPVYGDKWYETLTKAKLGDDSNLAVRQLREEIERERKTRDEQDAKRAADAKADEEARAKKSETDAKEAMEEFRTETMEFIKSKPEDYEVITALGLERVAADKARAHYQQTGRVLSAKECADSLKEELDKAIEKALQTKSWQGKVTKPPQPPPRAAPQFQTRTITGDMTPGPTPQNGALTKEQRVARAIAKLAELEAKQ